MTASVGESRRTGLWRIGSRIFAIIVAFIGAGLFFGGSWLATLGGSWYYVLAGAALAASAVGIWRGSLWGVWLHLLTCAGTWIWAVWEVGWDGWALVPRVVAVTVLSLFALLCIPVMGNAARRFRSQAVIALCALGLACAALVPHPEEAKANTSARTPASEHSASVLSARQDARTDADWPAWGGTTHGLRYSTLEQIDRKNVAKLERTWTYRTGDLPDQDTRHRYSPETTPLKIGDHLFLCSAKNILIALDASTGKEVWRHDPEVPDDAIPYGATCRGVAYYEDPAAAHDQVCARRIIEATLDARLIAVDAETGVACPDFGTKGTVSLLDGIGETVPGWYGNVAAPTIVRNIVVIGGQVQDGQAEDAPSGVIRGFDVVTGRLAWAWDMGHPERTGAPPAGETYTRGTPNMWTSAAGDDALGLVYVPLGNSAVDFYGANRRPFENEYSSSVVAIDVTTGKPVWHFQTVHYDVWDYDLGSQPTLVDVPVGGANVPAIVIPSKQGDIFVLDRRNGHSLFPVEERQVPGGGVEPQNLSRTQPFSTYHTVAKPPLTERDMWGISPIDQLWCRIQFHRKSYAGIYTPPTADRSYLQYPGYNGGTDWGSAAVDPRRGVLIVNYNNMPNNNRLITRAEANKQGLKPIYVPHAPAPPGIVEHQVQMGAPYAITINPGWRLKTGLMCTRPPYGGITAIDLASGRTLWDQPLGEARANGPFGIPSMLPFKIGTPNNGGPLVTAGGLIFIAAATDNLLRAIDIETGEVLWKDELPAGGQATPMAFEANGREFIGFMAGGHHFMHTPIGDYVLAYSLPSAGKRDAR